MNKKVLLIVTAVVVLVFGAIAFVVAGKNVDEPIEDTNPTISIDTVEYRKCVDDGGKVSLEAAPSKCVIDGKIYYDGNF